jgi:arylsulfatase A-like enzyme
VLGAGIVAASAAMACNPPFETGAQAPRSYATTFAGAEYEEVVIDPDLESVLPPPPPVQRVLIISEDGLRPDALSEERTPVHAALMRAGTTARVADTIIPSETLPSHASMLSGYEPADHKMVHDSFDHEKGYIEVPTLFSIAEEHGMSTAMFVGKGKLEHIARPGTVDYYQRPAFHCKAVVEAASEYLIEHKPQVTFVHFADPDDAGHRDGWMSKGYLEGVAKSDTCLGTLLGALDDAGLADSTLVIVTADHGGHKRTHSGARKFASDRNIPWIARGPGVAAGAWIETTVTTYDTAATALAALALPLPSDLDGVARLDLTRPE